MAPTPITHPVVLDYLASLRSAGRLTTARTYDSHLRRFLAWAVAAGVDLQRATTDQLVGYQLHLASDITPRTRAVRARTTQSTAIIVVQSLYAWMLSRNRIVSDPSAALVRPKLPVNRQVRKDHLSLQEATALIQTLAAMAAEETAPRRHAQAVRNLAMIALALATGRRVHGLVGVRVADIDLERNELRIEREKGHTGRVLPVAPWAMATVRRYLTEARPILVEGIEANPWLFLSQRSAELHERAVMLVLAQAVEETVRRNPDLTDLPHKRITSHSLRVSFACLLFQGGCNIRTINELMLHQKLSVTARYTPIPMADLRRSLLTTHLRA